MTPFGAKASELRGVNCPHAPVGRPPGMGLEVADPGMTPLRGGEYMACLGSTGGRTARRKLSA